MKKLILINLGQRNLLVSDLIICFLLHVTNYHLKSFFFLYGYLTLKMSDDNLGYYFLVYGVYVVKLHRHSVCHFNKLDLVMLKDFKCE